MSAIIMSLEDAKRNKATKLLNADLNTLIADATRNLGQKKQKLPDGVAVISLPRSKEYFTTLLQEIVINNKMISESIVLCALYVGEILYRAITNVPESLYAIDYLLKGLEEKTSKTLCEGGDLCFMYCTVFKERCHWRQMSEKSFTDIGQSLYQAGYSKSGCAVHYQMSVHFAEMTEITKEAFAKI